MNTAEVGTLRRERSALVGLAALADRALFAALLLALVMAPFEAGYPPMGRAIGLNVTNLEAALFILIAAWGAKLALDPGARRRVLRHPLLLPVAALVLAAVLATIFGEYTALGSHYIYRLLMGAGVLFASFEALAGRARLLAALATLLLAGAVSAAIGLLEFAPFFDIATLLTSFRAIPTTVGGVLRLSGTFEYANGAALYFELLLAVLVGLLIAFGGRDSRRDRLLRLACVGLMAVLAVALLLTLSRAAVVGLGAGLAFIAAVALWRGRNEPLVRRVLPPVALTVVVLAVAGIYLLLTQPMFRLRLITENDRDWYRATVTGAAPANSASQQLSTVAVTLHNDGSMIWRSQGALAVHLSYHWIEQGATDYAVFDGVRTKLPHDVAPGESAQVDALVLAPAEAGDYFIEWDLVQEGVTWFALKNPIAGQSRFPVTISQSTAQPAVVPPSSQPPTTTVATMAAGDGAAVSRMALWRTALAMFQAHPIFGVGPDGFRMLYGKYAGVASWNSNIYTNNTYIEMFANMGLVGGLAFLLLVGVALVRIGRNVFAGRNDAAWAVGLGAGAAIVAFLVHGFADYFLFSTPMYTIFWFLLGVAVMWPQISRERSGENANRR